MSSIPINPNPTVRRLNPHLYPPAQPSIESPGRQVTVNQSNDEEHLNKTERRYLAWLRCLGDDWIGVQCLTVKLANDCRLTMDFAAVDKFGLRLIDTKATNRKTGKPLVKEDAMIKMRVAARQFPFIRFLIAWEVNGAWQHQVIKP